MTWVYIQSLLHVLSHAFCPEKNGVPVPLSNSPQGPIWPYTGPETRNLVRSRPEGSFCEPCEPSTWHNAWDIMSAQYVCVLELLSQLINYLERRMKQKSGSL